MPDAAVARASRRSQARAPARAPAAPAAAAAAAARKRVAPKASPPKASPPSKKQKANDSWVSPIIDAGGSKRTGSFKALVSSTKPPHTLLLGTQPSNVSLAHGWYFGRDENAFWHIVGCALGFRRGFHVNQRSDGDVVPCVAKYLPPGLTVVPTYKEAVDRLQDAGYALWDVLESSERKSAKSAKKTSMDADIKDGKPAPIEAFVDAYPSVRRLVFVTGSGSAKIFQKHFAEWLASDRTRFVTGNAKAAAVFGAHKKYPIPSREDAGAGIAIELIVPPSVSPAAARFDGDFGDKKDNWLKDVFTTGFV